MWKTCKRSCPCLLPLMQLSGKHSEWGGTLPPAPRPRNTKQLLQMRDPLGSHITDIHSTFTTSLPPWIIVNESPLYYRQGQNNNDLFFYLTSKRHQNTSKQNCNFIPLRIEKCFWNSLLTTLNPTLWNNCCFELPFNETPHTFW